MAARQREISVSEFFTKNRHLLGFDNPRQGAADDREGGGRQLARRLRGGRHPARSSSSRSSRRSSEDALPRDGRGQRPGHRARRRSRRSSPSSSTARSSTGSSSRAASRASASAPRACTASSPPASPSSSSRKTGKGQPAHRIELRIDTKRNQPDVVQGRASQPWDKDHGTRVEIELEAEYRGGRTRRRRVPRADRHRQPAPRRSPTVRPKGETRASTRA